jgi:hypothetical protein
MWVLLDTERTIPDAKAIAQAMRDLGGKSFTKVPPIQGNALTPAPARIGMGIKDVVPARPTTMTAGQKKWQIEKLLEKHDLHPIEEMILMVKEGNLTNDQRIKLLDSLASYTVPKVKSVEVQHSGEVGITVNIVKFGDVQDITRAPVIDVEAA